MTPEQVCVATCVVLLGWDWGLRSLRSHPLAFSLQNNEVLGLTFSPLESLQSTTVTLSVCMFQGSLPGCDH